MNLARAKRHYWIRSLVLIGFTLLLADLILTERLNQYLAPRLHMLSYVTLGVFVLLTVVSLRQALYGPTAYECDCEDAHKLPRNRWTSIVIYSLFALPLLMGFVLPDKILGSAVAEKRGVTLLTGESNWVKGVTATNALDQPEEGKPADAAGESTQNQTGDAIAGSGVTEGLSGEPKGELPASQAPAARNNQQQSDEELRQKFNPEQFGGFYTDLAVSMYKKPLIQLDDKLFLDGLTTMELFAQEFAGKELETMGFVYRETGFTEDQFVVARFSVSCCTADATVFGILVELPEASKWEKDSWVQVRGKLALKDMDGYDMLILQAEDVKPVAAPKDPYVYYNFEGVPSS
ncbi:TIGR03943 family protein [Brevibacillus ruminantium]|uniref:TIGR03943 family protein n=1 Tax=Brevibacillus ruminantium TaxID=2950604 RepID=A0ABY4WGM5_9BACL|nr:TIGR03943 family protein [Brevibacillus ruminantium]USG63806.1 TIGR03943 family protein [Brevibacillus ruminantium]